VLSVGTTRPLPQAVLTYLFTGERFLICVKLCIVLCCCCFLLTAAGCWSQPESIQQSPATAQQSSSQPPAANSNVTEVAQNLSAQNSNTTLKETATTFDPCSLLTRAEVGSVQGEEIKETKAAPGNSRRLDVSQCYYQSTTPAKSVSLEVTRRLTGRPNALSPREFWEERFEKANREEERGKEGKREADKPSSRNEGEEEEEEGPPPQKVAGVGEEAFWAGNRIMGALYVLKGNTIIRISVGGVADQGARLEKTKALARLALQRLKD
jgi:hypothetical protein